MSTHPSDPTMTPAGPATDHDNGTIRVMVTVDSDDLREHAGKHADRGEHGAAHVLYSAATAVERGRTLVELDTHAVPVAIAAREAQPTGQDRAHAREWEPSEAEVEAADIAIRTLLATRPMSGELGRAVLVAAHAVAPEPREDVVETLVDPSFLRTVAKASWDRGERDYWDHETDMRPFDPSITELDGDDCDRGREWLETVTEVLTDAAHIARTFTPAPEMGADS